VSKISFRLLAENQLRSLLDYLNDIHPYLKRKIQNLDPVVAYLTGKDALPLTPLRLETISHTQITREDLKHQPLEVLLEYSDDGVQDHNQQKDILKATVIKPIDRSRSHLSNELPCDGQPRFSGSGHGLSLSGSSPPPPYKILSQNAAGGNDHGHGQAAVSEIDMASYSPGGIGSFSGRDIQSLRPSNDLTDTALDFLLGSLSTDTLNRPDSSADGPTFHIWPSIRIHEPTGSHETATWSPQANDVASNLSRYQLLPYFANLHWQIAVFDIINHTLDQYDCFWPDGTDQSTFMVCPCNTSVTIFD